MRDFDRGSRHDRLDQMHGMDGEAAGSDPLPYVPTMERDYPHRAVKPPFCLQKEQRPFLQRQRKRSFVDQVSIEVSKGKYR
jgi:hypothetical protein